MKEIYLQFITTTNRPSWLPNALTVSVLPVPAYVGKRIEIDNDYSLTYYIKEIEEYESSSPYRTEGISS